MKIEALIAKLKKIHKAQGNIPVHVEIDENCGYSSPLKRGGVRSVDGEPALVLAPASYVTPDSPNYVCEVAK